MIKYILLFFLLSTNIYAGDLIGLVVGKETGEPLSGATVRIEGSALGKITGPEGTFIFKDLKDNNYTLLISFLGYELEKVKVNVPASGEVNIKAELTEQALQTNEVVVSANKRVQAVQDVPISVSVIDNKFLLNQNVINLDEALVFVAGTEVNKDNVSIRGSSGFTFGVGSRVALLLDGFPLLAGDNGDMKFDALPLFNIDRIEVIKGAGSALYGTSAIGGVINVITQEAPVDPEFKVKAYTGLYTPSRHEQWDYSGNVRTASGIDAGYAEKIGDFGLQLSGGFHRDESYRLYDDSYRWQLFAKGKYDAGDKLSFALTTNLTFNNHTDFVYWNSLDSATYPQPDYDSDMRLNSDKEAIIGEMRYLFNSNNFMILRTGAYLTQYETTIDPNSIEYRQSNANSYNTELQFSSRTKLNLLLTYGLNFILNDVTSATYDDHTQKIYSAYLQGEYSGIDKLILTAGARLDQEATSGIETDIQVSPKLGLNYSVLDDLSLRASAGMGFRAPNIAERYSQINFAGFEVIPNIDLLPEKSASVEAGVNYHFHLGKSQFQIDAAGFYNHMEDLIEPTFVEDKIKFLNITEARVTGAELSIKSLLFGLFGLETSLTYMDPRDLTLDEVLKYRSEILWYSRLLVPAGPLEFQVDYRYKSEVENIDERLSQFVKNANARVPVHVVDARIIYTPEFFTGRGVSIILRANNLFDYYYTNMVANLAPTRYVGLQIDTRF